MHPRKSTSPARWTWRDIILLAPLGLAFVFMLKFAGPLPLTDEWGYSHAIRKLSGIDFLAMDGWSELRSLWPTRHVEHLVALPFAIYWPVATWADFDSRWIIALTLLAFGGQLWIYRRSMVTSAWAAIPVALVVFAPSHYIEFLWGWQLTLTLSVVLPLLGIVLIDRTRRVAGTARLLTLAAGLLLVFGGFASSAGGFFGFMAAAVLLALHDTDVRWKTGAIVTTLSVAALCYVTLVRTQGADWSLGWREFWYVHTAMGAALWGSPVGLTEFGFDYRSAGGLLVSACGLVCLGRAIVIRATPALALPISVTLFGLLCVVPIALVRPYLGNWHVQYILPTLVGTYALSWSLRQHDASRWSLVPMLLLGALLTSSVFGYVRGYTHYGPQYADYIESIEEHAFRFLTDETDPRPYPPQHPEKDLDAKLMLFLAARGHPLFEDRANSEIEILEPPMSELCLDGHEWPGSQDSLGPTRGPKWIVVRVPTGSEVSGGKLSWDEHQIRLWRMAEAHVPEHSRRSDRDYLAAFLLPNQQVLLETAPALMLFR